MFHVVRKVISKSWWLVTLSQEKLCWSGTEWSTRPSQRNSTRHLLPVLQILLPVAVEAYMHCLYKLKLLHNMLLGRKGGTPT